jgi:gamma-polyglutamate biosynthesis protein CapA
MTNKAKLLSICLFLTCLLLAYINVSTFNIEFSKANSNDIGIDIPKDVSSAVATTTENTKEINNKLNLYVVGDIMLARDVERKLLKYGSDYAYQKLNFNIEDSYTLANFESAIPSVHVPTPDNTFRFSVNEKYLSDLSKSGVTHVSLANNHAFDYGLAGYNNSITKLWDNNLTPFGHPSILSSSSVSVLQISDLTVAVVAIHTLFNTPNDELLQSILAYASSLSDIQIIYIHWGEEYAINQSSEQRKLATKLSNFGADIIIGHHPHVVQGVEKINDTIVFYSLGNYIFDQYFSQNVQEGLMLKISHNDLLKFELLPVTSVNHRAQPELTEGTQKSYFLEQLAQRSDQNLAEQIKSGVVLLDISLATSTEVAIMAE